MVEWLIICCLILSTVGITFTGIYMENRTERKKFTTPIFRYLKKRRDSFQNYPIWPVYLHVIAIVGFIISLPLFILYVD